jgi:hypothetical protein
MRPLQARTHYYVLQHGRKKPGGLWKSLRRHSVIRGLLTRVESVSSFWDLTMANAQSVRANEAVIELR